jgi:radical SAM protein with 4Fe4S-binding SPASM domain
MKRLQYRARQEWDGLEIFDRVQRQSFKITTGETETNWLRENKEQTEAVINTPYLKSSLFCSAPKRIYWEITRACNLNCANCYNRSYSTKEEMGFEKQRSLARTLYDNGVWIIQLTGGEPTMAPHVWELVSYLNELGFYVAMGSNGIYDRDTLDKMLRSLLDWIIISMDSEHEAQAGKITRKNILSARETVCALVQANKRVRVNTLIQRNNFTYKHLKPLAHFCSENKVESVNCIPLRPFVLNKAVSGFQLKRYEFKEFITGLKQLREEYGNVQFITTLDLQPTSQDKVYLKDKSCAAGREGCVISPFGEVYGCSYSLASIHNSTDPERRRFVAGNLNERSFMDIWNDSGQWAIYRELDKYKHQKCKECTYYTSNRCIGNCPVMVKGAPEAFDPYCYVDIV